MKAFRSLSLFTLILIFSAAAFAQSGRRGAQPSSPTNPKPVYSEAMPSAPPPKQPSDRVVMPKTPKIAYGKPAPDFELTSMDGKTFKLSELRGKVVVLNFWFAGCPPCRSEIPKLNALVEKYKDKDVVFIAPTTDDEYTAKKFLEKFPFRYNIVLDAGRFIRDEYTNDGDEIPFPQNLVIDKDGNLDTKIHGGITRGSKEAAQVEDVDYAIKQALKKPMKVK